VCQYTQREVKTICQERGLTSFILAVHEDAAMTRFARVMKESLRPPGMARFEDHSLLQARVSTIRTKFGALIPVHMQAHFVCTGDGDHCTAIHTYFPINA
jgi:hypothetical protein